MTGVKEWVIIYFILSIYDGKEVGDIYSFFNKFLLYYRARVVPENILKK